MMEILNWLKSEKLEEDDLYVNIELISLHPKFELLSKKIKVPELNKVYSLKNLEDMKIDTEEFLKHLFPGCKIIDKQSEGYGHPDFILEKDNNKVFLEIKFNEDTFRNSQFNWFFENKDRECWILFINELINKNVIIEVTDSYSEDMKI